MITKYLENKNFSTTLINFVYQFKCNNDEVLPFAILSRLMSYTNGIYNKEDKFNIEKLNRYIISYKVSSQSVNDVYFMNFSLLIPSKDIIKEDKLDSQIEFLLDSIYKPNIVNNLYDNTLFEREKRLYTENLLNGYKNIGFIAEKNMLDMIDSEGIINKLKFKDLDNINSLKNEDIVNFYNKYIKNTKPKILINGNIDKKKVNDIICDYFSNLDLKSNKLIIDYNNYLEFDNLLEKHEYANFYESYVYMIYNILDYKEEDSYKLLLINLLLSSSSSDILLDNLRKKSNLVYSCGSSIFMKNNLLVIKAITSKNNIEFTKKIIMETINSLKDIDKYKENICNILYRLNLNLERKKDNFYGYSDDLINNYFKTDKSLESELEILSNIERDELISVISRLNLCGIYVMEGNK